MVLKYYWGKGVKAIGQQSSHAWVGDGKGTGKKRQMT